MVGLSRLIRTAKKSKRNFRHASLVVKGGRILTCAYNDEHKHSEVRAIESLIPGSAKGSTIINIMIRRSDSIGPARPCANCMKFLKSQGVRWVLYTTTRYGLIPIFLRERIS